MGDVVNPQLRVYSIAADGGALQASQFHVFSLGVRPTEEIELSQFLVRSVAEPVGAQVQLSQLRVLGVCRGRVFDPIVRAWPYTLDGSDFWICRLGNDETLVYHVQAEQWYNWGSDNGSLWHVADGCNWQGGNFWAETFGSNVVVLDDTSPALFFLDPNAYVDEDAIYGSSILHPYMREITGQITTRSFDAIPCFGVLLQGSLGQMPDTSLTTVTLLTSDDRGENYDEYDTLTITDGEYNFRAEWWSLGSFTAPGRLFRIRDYGSLQRIDWLEMVDPNEDN